MDLSRLERHRISNDLRETIARVMDFARMDKRQRNYHYGMSEPQFLDWIIEQFLLDVEDHTRDRDKRILGIFRGLVRKYYDDIMDYGNDIPPIQIYDNIIGISKRLMTTPPKFITDSQLCPICEEQLPNDRKYYPEFVPSWAEEELIEQAQPNVWRHPEGVAHIECRDRYINLIKCPALKWIEEGFPVDFCGHGDLALCKFHNCTEGNCKCPTEKYQERVTRKKEE